MTADKARLLGAEAVKRVIDEGAYASLVIDQTLKSAEQELNEREQRFFTTLVYTTIEHQAAIDAVIGKVSKTPIEKMKPFVRALLRIGVCQLWYMDGVKPHAAVYETVGVIKASKMRNLAPFVNGVLRAVQREEKPVADGESLLSVPDWVVSMWENDYGEERCRYLTQIVKTKRPVCVRRNPLKLSAEAFEAALRETLETSAQNGSASVKRGTLAEGAYYLERTGNIGAWELYQNGSLSVQDESSMVAAMMADAKSGERILDLCAAPGGKSMVMAESMGNIGEIISRDLHEHRVRLIEENARRLGLTIIKAEQGDATAALEKDAEAFDKVLADVPCSGLGILRSKPDIALHHTEEDHQHLLHLQRQILETAVKAVRDGGRLIYSTCTLSKDENENQVLAFLKDHPEMHLIDLTGKLPSLPGEDGVLGCGLTLWPVDGGHDGFYVAVMEKAAAHKP